LKRGEKIPGPVIIGGVGGSGTRVVAEILRTLNFYIGNDLNGPLDNLAYTLLFKRPKWFYRHQHDSRTLIRGLRIMEKRMLKLGRLSVPEYLYLANACLSMSLHGHNRQKDGTGLWPLGRVKKMFELFPGKLHDFTGWGWKEPNTHLLIREMNDFFPGFKYIHTIRHGLDMAFSPNQQQLFNWGPMFGVRLPARDEDIPAASFRYWVEANRSVLEKGKQLGKDRFLMINFDQLCTRPLQEIEHLLSFMAVVPDQQTIDRIVSLPEFPNSTGRYKDKDLQWLGESDLSFLSSCGFKI